MKHVLRYVGLFLLLWLLLIFGLMFSSAMEGETLPDTDQRFSREEQIELMVECLQDARNIRMSTIAYSNYGSVPTLAAAFFRYRIK